MQEIYESVGQNVLSLRSEREWTQQELADRIGLSRASVANIETGRQRLLLHQVYDMAAALGCSVFQLMGEDEAKASTVAERLRQKNHDLTQELLECRAKLKQAARALA